MRKKYFALIILFIALTFILGINSNVYAAGATISASKLEIEKGETITINANIDNASAWELDVTATGGSLVKSDDRVGNTNSGQNENQTVKLGTFSANEANTYTITLSGYVVDGNNLSKQNVPRSIQITVKEKEETPPENQGNEENNNQNPGDNGNNNQNENQGNGGNNENTTPQEPEQTFTETNKIMYVKSDCTSLNLREGPDKTYKSIGVLKTNEKITVIAIGSKGWYKVRTESGNQGYVAGNYLTDEEPEKKNESSIATLSSIKVTPGNLNETFSKNNLSYTMTVEADVDSINVTATPTDDKAKVTVTGNTGLTTGTGNEITIKVVAEDGISTKTYKIKVTKLASEDEDPNIIEEPEEKKLGLSSLNIEGLKISPEFKSNVYEYKATLTDKTIEKLIVNAVATFEDSKVEITGADEIKDGENVITIIVTSANGEETVTYQVIVDKKEETVVAKVEPKEKEDSLQNIIIALIAAIAIVALILIFILIKRKEKAKIGTYYEDGDYNEPEENYNSYSKIEEKNTVENNQSNEEDDDDDWGTPKRGFRSKFRKTGRHF